MHIKIDLNENYYIFRYKLSQKQYSKKNRHTAICEN